MLTTLETRAIGGMMTAERDLRQGALPRLGNDRELGTFMLRLDVTAGDVADFYGVSLSPEQRAQTLAEYCLSGSQREFGSMEIILVQGADGQTVGVALSLVRARRNAAVETPTAFRGMRARSMADQTNERIR